MTYECNNKVFETKKEAQDFSRDLASYGCLGGWRECEKPVTHYYLGDLMTEPIDDFFGLIEERKEVAV